MVKKTWILSSFFSVLTLARAYTNTVNFEAFTWFAIFHAIYKKNLPRRQHQRIWNEKCEFQTPRGDLSGHGSGLIWHTPTHSIRCLIFDMDISLCKTISNTFKGKKILAFRSENPIWGFVCTISETTSTSSLLYGRPLSPTPWSSAKEFDWYTGVDEKWHGVWRKKTGGRSLGRGMGKGEKGN